MKARTLLVTAWLVTALVAAGCSDTNARSAASRHPDHDRETASGSTSSNTRSATQVEESSHDTGSPATPEETRTAAMPPAPRSSWQPPAIPLPDREALEPVPPQQVAPLAEEMPLEPAAPQTPVADNPTTRESPVATVPVPETTPQPAVETAPEFTPATESARESVTSGSNNPLRRSAPAAVAPRPRPSLASNPLRASGSMFAPTAPAPTAPAPTAPPPPLPLPSASAPPLPAPTAPAPTPSTPLFPRIPRIASNPRIPTEPRDNLNLPLPASPKSDNPSIHEPSGGAAPPAGFVPPPPPPFPRPAGSAPPQELTDDTGSSDAPRELVAAEGAPPTSEEMPAEEADAPATDSGPAMESPEAAAVPESATPDEVIPPTNSDSEKNAFRLGPAPPRRSLAGPSATIEDDQFAHDDESAEGDGVSAGDAGDESAAMGLLDNDQGSNGTKGNTADAKKADPFTVVKVFYGTDRMPLAGGSAVAKRSVLWLATFVLVMLVLAFAAWTIVYRKSHHAWAGAVAALTVAVLCIAIGRPVSLSGLIGKNGPSSQVAYGNGRGELAYGEVEVTIPKDHKVGQVERPSIMRLEIQERSDKHVVIRRIDQWEEAKFFDNVKQRVTQSPREDLFVFIHGYNVSFDMAARRTAQMAHDMQFEGAPIFYSWPSQGGLLQYPVDENNVAWTVPHLKQFLRDLIDRTDAKAVNIIAHSMGNRALSSAVRELALEKSIGDQQFNQIVLAAPDIDAEVFKRDIAPVLTKTSQKVTLYASSHDQALVASKLVHGYPRAGDSGSNLLVLPGVETIDVSDIDTGILGHSYYASSRPILRDLNVILRSSQAAARRPWLEQAEHDGLGYWIFEAKTIATRDSGPRR